VKFIVRKRKLRQVKN